jgi:hypothetical protein
MDKTYIIPLIFEEEEGKIAIDIVGVTEEEFIEWYKSKSMPKANISVVFMKEYFKKHKYNYDFEKMEVGREEVLYPKHLSDFRTKQILCGLGVNIEDFTKEYGEYLYELLKY